MHALMPGPQHVIAVHVSPAPHAWPHEPQFCASYAVSVQTPLHAVLFSVQSPRHWLPRQVSSAPQTLPGLPPSSPQPAVAPQCVASALGSTQRPPQTMVPLGQPALHTPL